MNAVLEGSRQWSSFLWKMWQAPFEARSVIFHNCDSSERVFCCPEETVALSIEWTIPAHVALAAALSVAMAQ